MSFELTVNPDAEGAQIIGQSGNFNTALATSTSMLAAGTIASIGTRNHFINGYEVFRYVLGRFPSRVPGRLGLSHKLRLYFQADNTTSQDVEVLVVGLNDLAWPLVRETAYDLIRARGQTPIGTIITTPSDTPGSYYELEIPVNMIGVEFTTFGLLTNLDVAGTSPGTPAPKDSFVDIRTEDNASNKPELVLRYAKRQPTPVIINFPRAASRRLG